MKIACKVCVSWPGFWTNSLFTCSGEEAHHLHSQLQALKVVLQILPFDGEAILLVSTRKERLPALQTIKQHLAPQSQPEVCSWVVCHAIIWFNYSSESVLKAHKPDVLLIFPAPSTHKLTACCVSAARRLSNTNVDNRDAFWELPALQTVRVWLIDFEHHVIMKFGQKSKSCHIFLVENEGPGEC